jgi:AbrB family looped-hinge helix DNA binding protein
MAATARVLPEIQNEITVEATVTSKGQITIPVEVRRLLMVDAGDKVTFRANAEGVTVERKVDADVFERLRGTGGFELPKGYEGIEGTVRFVREMRGHDEYDDLISSEE